MIGARTAIALYLALALHALAVLLLVLAPSAQMTPGAGQGLGIGLRLAGSDNVLSLIRVPQIERSAPTVAQPRAWTPIAQAATKALVAEVDTPTSAPVTRARVGGGGADTRYFARLRQHLHRFRRELPLDPGAGRAEVALVVEADGSVSSLKLTRSSRSALLDEEAQALVLRAQPLPRPPGGKSLRVVVPVLIES